jgi:hypothetical protein
LTHGAVKKRRRADPEDLKLARRLKEAYEEAESRYES